jgi:hypothetical protein
MAVGGKRRTIRPKYECDVVRGPSKSVRSRSASGSVNVQVKLAIHPRKRQPAAFLRKKCED